MNIKRTLALFALCGACVLPAAYAESYAYGMPVDVAKVISITPAENADKCEVGTAHMVYVDHQGQTHELSYEQLGDCSRL